MLAEQVYYYIRVAKNITALIYCAANNSKKSLQKVSVSNSIIVYILFG